MFFLMPRSCSCPRPRRGRPCPLSAAKAVLCVGTCIARYCWRAGILKFRSRWDSPKTPEIKNDEFLGVFNGSLAGEPRLGCSKPEIHFSTPEKSPPRPGKCPAHFFPFPLRAVTANLLLYDKRALQRPLHVYLYNGHSPTEVGCDSHSGVTVI